MTFCNSVSHLISRLQLESQKWVKGAAAADSISIFLLHRIFSLMAYQLYFCTKSWAAVKSAKYAATGFQLHNNCRELVCIPQGSMSFLRLMICVWKYLEYLKIFVGCVHNSIQIGRLFQKSRPSVLLCQSVQTHLNPSQASLAQLGGCCRLLAKMRMSKKKLTQKFSGKKWQRPSPGGWVLLSILVKTVLIQLIAQLGDRCYSYLDFCIDHLFHIQDNKEI